MSHYLNSKAVRGKLQHILKHGPHTQKELAAKMGVLKARREPSGKLLEWMGLERLTFYRVKRQDSSQEGT